MLSLHFITVTVGVFLFPHLSSFTYLFVLTEDPVNSKWIMFTTGMVGDYSGLLHYIYIIFIYTYLDISHLQPHVRPNATLQMKNCIGPEWDLNPRPAVYMTAVLTN